MRTAAPSTTRSAASLEPDLSSPSQQNRLARAAASAGAATMTSRVLGLARDQLLASLFGAGDAMDAFNVAFRIPNLVRDLFAEGAMSAAFVPVFMRQLALGDREAAWRLASNVINALLVVTGVLVVLGILFARPLVGTFAADYADVPGKLELTVLLTRIMLPFLTLVAVAAVSMGMLNSLHRFFVPALAPAMFNIATILCALLLVPVMPRLGLPPIAAIAVVALRGARRSRGGARDARRGPLADVRAERAGDDRPDRAVASDRARDLRAPGIFAVRHRGDRGGAAVLRGGAARVFHRENRVAHVLRARRQPNARANQHRVGRGQRRVERRARPCARVRRPGARDVDRGVIQRWRPAVAVARPSRWAGRPAGCRFARQDRNCFTRDGNGGAGRQRRAWHVDAGRHLRAAGDPAVPFDCCRPPGAWNCRACAPDSRIPRGCHACAEARRFQGIDVARRSVVGTDWINAIPVSFVIDARIFIRSRTVDAGDQSDHHRERCGLRGDVLRTR